jgi:hypothetical protein
MWDVEPIVGGWRLASAQLIFIPRRGISYTHPDRLEFVPFPLATLRCLIAVP